ncbi:MAG: sigma-70 family RNA polymerase sigma factor [Planctomycetota bacterium]
MPQSPPETRASLLLRLQNAEDVAAWDEFTSRYGPLLFHVARRRGFQIADAENLVQEVLLSVARSLPRWLERDDRGSFRAWLLRIARNEAVDMLTERATRDLGHDGGRGQRLLDAVSVRNDISSLIDREYQLAAYRRAAERVQQSVAEETWLAFVLTEVEGRTVQQAAAELGTSKGHIYVSRSRVMARIKGYLREQEEQP